MQPHTAARAMLGQDATYTELPYFFTDQYDPGMEYFGYRLADLRVPLADLVPGPAAR